MTVDRPPGTSPMDIDAALANPSAYFDEPHDVLAHPGISNAFKLRLLRQWEIDARLLAEAEGEGMGGGEESKLGRVRQAIRALEASMNDRGIAEGLGEAANLVQHAALRTEDGVTEFRKFMRAQPITGALLMLAFGYLIGQFAGRRR